MLICTELWFLEGTYCWLSINLGSRDTEGQDPIPSLQILGLVGEKTGGKLQVTRPWWGGSVTLVPRTPVGVGLGCWAEGWTQLVDGRQS